MCVKDYSDIYGLHDLLLTCRNVPPSSPAPPLPPSPSCVTHLLRNFTSSSPFLVDSAGFTPLHYASNYGHKMAVQILLDYAPGNNLASAASDTKSTPLHLAVSISVTGVMGLAPSLPP